MKNLSLLFLAAVAILFSACKATVEGEQNNYKANLKSIEALGGLYPSFKPALDAIKAEGEAAFKAAEAQAGEGQAQAMREANNKLFPSFLRDLQDVSKNINSLREKRTKVQNEGQGTGTILTSMDVDQVINEAEANLKKPAGTAAELEAIVSTVVSSLKSMEKSLDELIAKKEAEKKAAAGEKANADSAAKAEKAAAEKAASPIKCGFCGKSNEPKSTKCGGCGADLAK